jgi:hypothetical protein
MKTNSLVELQNNIKFWEEEKRKALIELKKMGVKVKNKLIRKSK